MRFPPIPEDVVAWVRQVFKECDYRISAKLSRVPQCPESSLDLTFIEHLSTFSSPRILKSGWSVRIDTHFLGGMRHFLRSWEIGDIGVLIHFRHDRKIIKSKAAVMQSKRLYPNGQQINEDLPINYEMGFGRLHDPEDARVPLHHGAEFVFDRKSRYGALEAKSDQVKAIDQYSVHSKVPVFYQFYNPLQLPFVQRFPLQTDSCTGELKFGTRIVAASEIHDLLKRKKKHFSPTVNDIAKKSEEFGWPLAHFVADLLLGCKLGYVYDDLNDESIFGLFNRRSGPIAAAVAVSIESPDN